MVVAVVMLCGCGSDGGSNGVRFEGNIVEVRVPEAQEARGPEALPEKVGLFARLVSIVFPAAVAQQQCDPDAARVLACAVTAGGERCDRPAFQCERVNASSCEFSTEVRVTCADFAGVIFVLDEDGDGRRDANEKDASLGFSCSSEEPERCILEMCNGDVIRAQDVTIEFFAEPVEDDDGVAEAEEIEKTRNACASPTRTPTPTPTVTPMSTQTPFLGV